MSLIKVPRLYRNRCGTYCFRLKTSTLDQRFSLGTKCPQTATMLALQLNTEIERSRAMAYQPKEPNIGKFLANLDPNKVRRYRIDMKQGIFEANGPEDHAMMMDAVERIGMKSNRSYDPEPVAQPSTRPEPAPAVLKTRKLKEVAEAWLAERATKNGERTVYGKKCHFNDFAKRIASDVEINAINKATIVAYKTTLLNLGQKGKTIDNKLMSLHDLFAYAIAHGEYTFSNESPVSGLFILSKQERLEKNEPYERFEDNELKTLFNPATYIEQMDEPDLFWGPLIALHTGMRISEVAQLRCRDFGVTDGTPYLHVYRSKTPAGIRNLPLGADLLKLGLLDYLEEVKASGAGRLFPHRPYVNNTYSKRLGELFGAHLKFIGIKRQGLSFHSFRVNVVTAMANANVPLLKSMAIVGHKRTEGVNQSSIQTHFGYVRDLPDLKPVMDGFHWGLDIEALKYDGRFKAFVANKKNWKEGQNGTLGGD